MKLFRNNKLAAMVLSLQSLIACETTDSEGLNAIDARSEAASASSVSIENPGFESSWEGWSDSDPSALSGDSHSGSKSAKISGSGGRFEQVISVEADKDYTLSAYVLGGGVIGAEVGSNDYSQSGDYNEWTEVDVAFNSGSNTSITIYGAYHSSIGRFDDFTLFGADNGNDQLNVASVSASADDGNLPENTLDQDFSTRWSADGNGAYITYDLGVAQEVSSMKIAWYKGDQRAAYFKIRAGLTTSSMSTVYDGSTSGSSGNTLGLENYSFETTTARYVRVTGFGNSENTWNSVTEAAIFGSTDDGGDPSDMIPPGSVTNLLAVPENGSVRLSWSNPSDSDFDHVEISYDGTVISTSAESKVIAGLTNGTTYTFEVVAFDEAGNASSASQVTATPESQGGAEVPSDLMSNCDQWKITYPDGVEDKTLCGEDNNEYFFVNSAGDGIVFRAPIRSDNGTTPNSNYVRSELRERTADGKSDIYWTTSGTNVIYVKQAITHLPIVKDHLVATQIHGDKSAGIDDAMVLRLEGSHLFLSFNGEKLRSDLTITNNYVLGTPHEVIFEVINGKHYCYYSEDGNLKAAFGNGTASAYLVKDGSNNHVMDIDYEDAYFKVGNYTQSNPDKEGSATNDPDNYGEVVVYDFYVDHQ